MLESRQSWFHPTVAAGGAAFGLLGIAAAISSPRPDPASVLAVVIFPTLIGATMLGGAWRWPTLFVVATALLDVEAGLSGLVFANGIGLAILLPFVGLGLLQPGRDPRVVRIVYGGAGVATTIGATLAILAGPAHALPSLYPPVIALSTFVVVVALVLGFNWRLSGRLVEVIAEAQRELATREAAEEELRRTEERLRAVVAAAPLAIALTNREGTIQVWNREAERIYGAPAAEAIGRPVSEVTEMGASQFEEFRRTMAAGGSIAGLPISRRQADGRQLELRLFLAPLRDDEGSVTGAVSIIEDLSDRRALEAQLRQSQKMETMGQLAGTIAHDFNNLLTAIRGFAEIAAASLGPDHEVGQDLAEIRAAADRAADLTRRLLAFSSQTPAGATIHELNAVVQGMEPMLRRLIGPTVDLRMSLSREAGYVRIDRGQLEQAVLNLVINARDALPDGGTIKVATGIEHVEATPTEDAHRVAVLTIEDTGVGMVPEVVERAFEPFFTTKKAGQGTGLGLAIVFGAVRNADGEITIDSRPGAGSTFRIALPSVVPVAEGVADAVPASQLGGAESILLVEDEAAIRSFATRILTRHGYRVRAAAGAAEALGLHAANPDPFDLLLSDVTMPGLPGPALVDELRAADPELRVLFMSGFVPGGRGPTLPADAGFLHKPFSGDELLRAVRAALDQEPGVSQSAVLDRS